jgi:hypothetical protein
MRAVERLTDSHAKDLNGGVAVASTVTAAQPLVSQVYEMHMI